MKRPSSPFLLLLLLLAPTPSLAAGSTPMKGIGSYLDSMPMWVIPSNESATPPVTEESKPLAAVVSIPIEPAPPEPAPATPVVVEDQTDPISTWLWAYAVNINTVKSRDLPQYGMRVKTLLAMRKLGAIGLVEPVDGNVTNLSSLTPKGKELLKYLERSEVRSLLATIRYAEGTLDDDGYYTFFGHGRLNDLKWHPMTTRGTGSSASGAYQAMDYSFPGAAKELGLADFTPLSQDLFALNQMTRRNVDLANFTDADLETIIKDELSKEWASLPNRDGVSRYTFKGRPQPAKSYAKLWDVYAAARAGKLPRMGYDAYHWNDAYANALQVLQFDYEVKATGDFDAETYAALFDGTFGTAGPDQPPPQPINSARRVATKDEMYPAVKGMPYIKVSRTDAWGYNNGMQAVSVQVFAADGTQLDIFEAFSGIKRAQNTFGNSAVQLQRGSGAPPPRGLYKINEHRKADGPIPDKVRNINDVWLYMEPETYVGTRTAIGIHGAPSGATAGCIGLFSKKDAHRLSELVLDQNIQYVIVDWGV